MFTNIAIANHRTVDGAKPDCGGTIRHRRIIDHQRHEAYTRGLLPYDSRHYPDGDD